MFDACRLLYVHDVSPESSNDVVVECFAYFGEFLAEELCIRCLKSDSLLIAIISVLLSFDFSILVAIHCLISRFLLSCIKRNIFPRERDVKVTVTCTIMELDPVTIGPKYIVNSSGSPQSSNP